jgi:hypothetical protein
MAGAQGQRDAAIALKDTFGKAADDITSKTADFHGITADTALQGARDFSNVDNQFGDTFNGIKPGEAPADARDPVASPPPASASSPSFHDKIQSILDPEHDEAGEAGAEPSPERRKPTTPASGHDPVAITDQTAATQAAIDELSTVPSKVYSKVSKFMEDKPGGGISIGDKPINQLPGGETLTGAPRGWPAGSDWGDVAGVYLPGSRRLLINSSGASASVSVPLHEFGHGADSAYGDLSNQSEWQTVQNNVTNAVGKDPNWSHYYDHPQELFAEGFASWVKGGDALKNLALGNAQVAKTMEDYFERQFG